MSARTQIRFLIWMLLSAASISAFADATPIRLIVSFGTPCCALDPDMPAEVAAFIADFERDAGIVLAADVLRWGEHGETNVCYPLTELAPPAQQDLIEKLRAFTARSARTFVRENAPCDTHTRAPRG